MKTMLKLLIMMSLMIIRNPYQVTGSEIQFNPFLADTPRNCPFEREVRLIGARIIVCFLSEQREITKC
jgi:hypothetical protein